MYFFKEKKNANSTNQNKNSNLKQDNRKCNCDIIAKCKLFSCKTYKLLIHQCHCIICNFWQYLSNGNLGFGSRFNYFWRLYLFWKLCTETSKIMVSMYVFVCYKSLWIVITNYSWPSLKILMRNFPNHIILLCIIYHYYYWPVCQLAIIAKYNILNCRIADMVLYLWTLLSECFLGYRLQVWPCIHWCVCWIV